MNKKEDFTQLKMRFTDPIQQEYETIRPVVLFAQPIGVKLAKLSPSATV
jgi:hypothetical protein